MTGMRKIGITGGIGSGKTEVTNILRGKGFFVIDADEISREIAKPGEPALDSLREKIGDTVFFEDGSLNRQALAGLIFNDPDAMKTVNEIFHPEVKKRIADMVSRADSGGKSVIFISAPLLFESGTDGMVDEIWLVAAEESVRISRVMDRDGLSGTKILERIRNQMPEAERRERADLIIENDDSIDRLRSKIEGILALRGLC